MSRAGRIRLTPGAERVDCAELLREVVGELGPAASQSIRFFADGLMDLITAPVADAAARVTTEMQTQGAHHLSISVPDISREYDALRTAVIRRASELRVSVPDALARKPDLVSARMVEVQQQALDTLNALEPDSTQWSDLVQSFAEAIEEEQEAVEQAFEDACLIAGRAGEGASASVLGSVEELLASTEASSDSPVADEIRQLAGEARSMIGNETEEAWTLTALAASKIAVEEAGFDDIQPNVSEGRLTAQDVQHSTGGIEISLDPEGGLVSYELVGYEDDACVEPERRFLDALSSVIGTEISARNLQHWSTVEEREDRGIRERAAGRIPDRLETERTSDRLRDDRRAQAEGDVRE